MTAKTQATIEDLYHVPGNGKAEIVDGELVLMSPTGFWPSRVSGAIYASLREHERKTKSGYALPDNAAFIVDLPNRRSFSPDAAWYTGRPTGSGSWKKRQPSRLRSEAKAIMARAPSKRWLKNGETISLRERSVFGMWTCSAPT